MKKLYIVCFIPIVCFASVYLEYGKSWGRFGDNLLSYMHTKYVSYVTGIPVLYTPFIYSDQLKFSAQEHRLKRQADRKMQINESFVENGFKKFTQVKNKKDETVVLEVPYCPEDLYEYRKYKHINAKWIFIPVNWQDQKFKTILQEVIAPKNNLDLVKIPENKITIAIHVRDGSGFDDADAYLNAPLKFPPLEYYVESLQEIISLVGTEKELYAHIFTDHPEPKRLLKYFQEQFSEFDIEFACRLHNNKHDKNVLEDFFSLALFDCLIRTQSNFSICAAKIADYKIEIEPLEFIIKNKHVEITKKNIIEN